MTTPVDVTDLPTLPPRPSDSHKGTYGKVLIVGGSRGMSGAAILAGMGALRGGAGLVQVAVPAEILPIVAGYNPCYLTTALPQDDHGRLSFAAEEVIMDLAGQCDVLAIGPGLGRSDALTHLVERLWKEVAVALIIDADGLNALADVLPAKPITERRPHPAPRILTPHPGEFARLSRVDPKQVQARRRELAVQFAHGFQVVLALKGHETLVTEGERCYRNTTGNAGMATGGTGDVLTGLIAALIAQKLEPFDATRLGVSLHGLAGDHAGEHVGVASLIATDVVDYLPSAFNATRQSPAP